MILSSLFKSKKKDTQDASSTKTASAAAVSRVAPRKQSRNVRRLSHTNRLYHAPKLSTTNPKAGEALLRPVITEKAADLSEKQIYTFLVHGNATVHTVAHAVEAMYGVRPRRVRIAKRPEKRKQIRLQRSRRQQHGFTTPRKKAYVVLKLGDSITLV